MKKRKRCLHSILFGDSKEGQFKQCHPSGKRQTEAEKLNSTPPNSLQFTLFLRISVDLESQRNMDVE